MDFPLFYDITTGGDVTYDIERYDDECDKRAIRSRSIEANDQIRGFLNEYFEDIDVQS